MTMVTTKNFYQTESTRYKVSPKGLAFLFAHDYLLYLGLQKSN